MRLQNELITLARVPRDGLAKGFERHEPNTGHGLAVVAVLVLARISRCRPGKIACRKCRP